MKKLMTLIILLVLLAACTPVAEQDNDDSTRLFSEDDTTRVLTEVTEAAGTPAPEVATRSAETPAAEATTEGGRGGVEVPADAAIVLRQEGGITGETKQWTIYQNGRVVDVDGNEFQVPAEVVQGLVATAESAGFFDLAANYMPMDTCCDRITYWLAVRQGDTVHTVQVLEAEPSVPPAFWTILTAVQSAIEAAAGTD